jgi:hypothetical protein
MGDITHSIKIRLELNDLRPASVITQKRAHFY